MKSHVLSKMKKKKKTKLNVKMMRGVNGAKIVFPKHQLPIQVTVQNSLPDQISKSISQEF